MTTSQVPNNERIENRDQVFLNDMQINQLLSFICDLELIEYEEYQNVLSRKSLSFIRLNALCNREFGMSAVDAYKSIEQFGVIC